MRGAYLARLAKSTFLTWTYPCMDPPCVDLSYVDPLYVEPLKWTLLRGPSLRGASFPWTFILRIPMWTHLGGSYAPHPTWSPLHTWTPLHGPFHVSTRGPSIRGAPYVDSVTWTLAPYFPPYVDPPYVDPLRIHPHKDNQRGKKTLLSLILYCPIL